ncbi:uncharacterized protein LOC133318771, partial [Danaus plexippus]|uniref:uncharacterized protein LOC133318771 n=1 Tax=Danaus plexippus TaxID=13037 RepID=UPI002AB22A08
MNRIEFEVNGAKCSVGEEVSSTTTLLDYIRTTLELRGTKYMCLEGGCGACIVSVITHPGDDQLAVTSCMVSVTSCHGWQITTIEKLGNRKDGYHPLQKALASHNGTQCGYCSPGFVMSMYSKLKSRKNLKMLDIERDLSSNICRCTGFRPILEAFKKFASDAPESKDLLDIEELEICQKPNRFCSGSYNYYNDFYFVSKNEIYHNNWHINLKDGKTWHKAFTVDDILNILTLYGLDSYMLVAGNTGKGVIPIEEYPRNLIDISGVKELKGYLVDQNLVIGAGLTISNLMEIFQEISDTENFEYLKVVNDHLQYVGNIAIRNA